MFLCVGNTAVRFEAIKRKLTRTWICFCVQVVELPGYVKLDADHGRWPQDGFCQVAFLNNDGSASYALSADLYNFIGRDGVNMGHLGVFFNAEDEDNYDFVYFRLEKSLLWLGDGKQGKENNIGFGFSSQ